MIPVRLARNVIDVHASSGRKWLERLPALIAECAERWSLEVGTPFPNLSYNYVAPARKADSQVVLKAGVPGPELSAEIAALNEFQGQGVVRLLYGEPDRGILLLERVRPGTPLTEVVDDEAATSFAARAMRAIWRAPTAGHSFPSVSDWGRGLGKPREQFHGGTGPLPQDLVVEAERVFDELAVPPGSGLLLHGDLHHHNILRCGDGSWVAIDPMGVVGDPGFEVGAFLQNPPGALNGQNPRLMLEKRITRLSDELGFEPERIRRWGLARAVLSAWWSLVDHGDRWQSAVQCARHLDAIGSRAH